VWHMADGRLREAMESLVRRCRRSVRQMSTIRVDWDKAAAIWAERTAHAIMHRADCEYMDVAGGCWMERGNATEPLWHMGDGRLREVMGSADAAAASGR